MHVGDELIERVERGIDEWVKRECKGSPLVCTVLAEALKVKVRKAMLIEPMFVELVNAESFSYEECMEVERARVGLNADIVCDGVRIARIAMALEYLRCD
jgi:hypothetical protein